MPCPLDIGPSSWYVESLTRRRHDVRLHEGPARKVLPELQKARVELDQAYREIKVRLGQQDQETLLQLADLENELREEASLTSFIVGFRLGMGIAGELEPYCFEDEDERRATERAKMRCPQVKI